MIATTRPQTDEIEKMIEGKTSELNEKLDKLTQTIKDSNKPKEDEKKEKIDDILAKIKAKQAAQKSIDDKKEVPEGEKKEEKKEHDHNHEDIPCPTCMKGGMHKMVGNGLNLKCADGSCGKEYVIVPKDADAKCKTCGLPLNSGIKVDSCPFCHGTGAKLFDFSKLKGVK
jgi:Zn finger protein HypA/HybF involved in hydrogenase expression